MKAVVAAFFSLSYCHCTKTQNLIPFTPTTDILLRVKVSQMGDYYSTLRWAYTFFFLFFFCPRAAEASSLPASEETLGTSIPDDSLAPK